MKYYDEIISSATSDHQISYSILLRFIIFFESAKVAISLSILVYTFCCNLVISIGNLNLMKEVLISYVQEPLPLVYKSSSKACLKIIVRVRPQFDLHNKLTHFIEALK